MSWAIVICAAVTAAACSGARRAPVEAFGNMGWAVNTTDDDYAPVLPDTAMLVLTSNRTESGEASLQTQGGAGRPARLYFSMRLGERWDGAQPYRLMFDAPRAQTATVSFAPSGSPFGIIAYVAACDRPDTVGGCDLYGVVQRESAAMVNLGREVNSSAWDGHPCVTPDGARLYFASDRPGGMGGNDIWIADRLPSGAWGSPRNAGPDVNTALDELSPFYDAASGTLYMAAATPDSGFDIYAMERNSGTRRRLSAPYNSDADDITPFMRSGMMYLASNRGGGCGGFDLYAFAYK